MAMNKVTFVTDLFELARVGGRDGRSHRSEKALGYYLWLLYQLNVDFLRENPRTVRLYESGVRYKAERPSFTHPEQWRMIPKVIEYGVGDCEDLACWLAAEFTVQRGIPAKPFWSREVSGRNAVYHIRVRTRGGRILDPSKVLGMPG